MDITNQVSDKITEELIKMRSLNLITEKNWIPKYKNRTEASFIYSQKIKKRIYQGDQFAAQLSTPPHT